MYYQWNWMIFWDNAPEDGLSFFDTLISGLFYTLMTATMAWLLATLIGTLIGTMRTSTGKTLPRIADLYINLFCRVPLLVQLFLWYFVVPEFLPENWGDWIKNLQNAPLLTGIVCVGFYTAARIAMLVVTGIHSLTGLQGCGTSGPFQRLQKKVHTLPDTLRLIAPALTNEAAAIIKNSSVALTIGLLELTVNSGSVSELSFQAFEAFTAATMIYIVVSLLAIATESWTSTRN
jgi:glutamate/aspartate transport system permease protein